MIELKDFWQQMHSGISDFKEIILPGIKFDNLFLQGLDFSNANISSATINRTEFENCIFNETDLSNTTISEAIFKNCSFNDANLSKCDIEEGCFTNSQFTGTKFTEFRANHITFKRCNLQEAKFIDACMIYAGFYSSNLSKSQWHDVDWSGSFTECNLVQADMNDMRAGEVIIVNSIYPNGTIGDLDWYDIEVQGEPPTPEPSITIHSKDKVELRSETGTDYSMLRDLLSECRWKAAQTKTHELITSLEGEGIYYISPESIITIPCTDLITIDCLWTEYSWGRFGFSIQNEIWMSIYEGYERNSKKYDAFLEQIWTNKLINIEKSNDAESIKLFPVGYYPNYVDFFIPSEVEIGLATLYHYLSGCKI
jgi:uncharacterized protein YjbI with pentapeptide repeats